MRSALKTTLIVVYSVVFVCVALLLAEYSARKVVYGQLGSPSRQTELILDRWTAFRNNPNYKSNGVQLNSEGFRRDQDVTLDKPPDTVRIFLLGGSTAYGGETLYPEIDDHWRIDNHQTIDHYLEKRLSSTFPAKRWEVINAAVKGYLLNQDLAMLLSTVQRYQPDYLILLDGVNDLFSMLRFPEKEDGYSAAGLGDEFNGLTKPGSMSLRLMASSWLFNNSALYRSVRESVAQRNRINARRERARKSTAHLRPDFASLTLTEQQQYQAAVGGLNKYLRPVRQICRLAQMEGTQVVFVLQPEIAGTRKPLTSVETQLLDYWSRLEPLFVYGFQTLYPQLSSRLTTAAATEGYRFLDLTNVFDRVNVQTFTDYCHLTPAGNQIVADAILDSLASSLGPSKADGAR
ncbi:MAG TPA: SGNH/GDSL hydrolase family protein [Bryobacteraceae bacterium]|jgi:lysophospholipase L1-like esterase|nr:SGNH/GDSL hydrolase family protein [Bryobacteraceae bacterium]